MIVGKTGKAAWALLFFIIFLFVGTNPVFADQPTNPYAPSGPMMDDYIGYQFAVYYLPTPAKDPVKTVRKLLKDGFPRFRQVDAIEKSMDSIVQAQFVEDVEKEYPVYGPDFVERFGRGLSNEQKKGLLDSEKALLLNFGYHKSHVWDGYKDALELTLQVAVETGGVLWDEETREFFSPDAWRFRRLEGWMEGMPVVPRQVTMHAYRIETGVRVITLGMSKFGLPDVVIEKLPKAYSDIGLLINMVCQTAAEGVWIGEKGAFRVDVERLHHSGYKSSVKENMTEDATGAADIVVRQGTHDEGDPNNRLIEITFENAKGETASERQISTMIQLFGVEDNVTQVSHNDEILAASQRAKAKLPALRDEFNKGLEPGGAISVKAPFKTTAGGNEWMWILVTEWKGETITGVLLNVPADVPDLNKGAVVTVSQADIFDYYREKGDGTTEGNETGELIRKYAAQ